MEILSNLPSIMALLALPAYFIIFWAKDVIMLKVNLVKGKKNGAKFVVGISADKTLRISAETPVDKNKFVFTDSKGQQQEVNITPDDLLFAPQFGVQAAMVTQGSKKIFNPFNKELYDPIDGDYIAVAIDKAKQLGMFGAGWGSTKEQKLMILVLIAVIGVGVLTFAGISQTGSIATQLTAYHSSMMELVRNIPVGL